jgi:hypothetical protein
VAFPAVDQIVDREFGKPSERDPPARIDETAQLGIRFAMASNARIRRRPIAAPARPR